MAPRAKRKPSHKGQVRFGYAKLSKPYKARLVRQGITQRQWEDGADLRVVRGHKPRLQAPGVSPELVASVVDRPTVEQLRLVEKTLRRPAWLPKEMSIEVAAALSQLPNPNRWVAVTFEPEPNGAPWRMNVTLKGNAYPVSILIPGGGSPGSGAVEVLDFVREVNEKRMGQPSRTTSMASVFEEFDRSYTGNA